MKDFRGPLPLGDRDFVEIRKNVVSKIGRRRVVPLVFQLAAAAAAVVVLAFLLIPRPTVPNKIPIIPKATSAVAPPKEPAVVAEVPVEKHAPKPHRKTEQIASVGGPPQDSQIYLDIQTSDPNVRIIWIARR